MTLNSTIDQTASTTLDSLYLIDAALSFKLTAYEFKVYIYLTRSANPLGQITQSTQAIASNCFLNRKTVVRVLDSLINMGMLRRLMPQVHQLTMPPEWVERAKKTLVFKRGIGARSQESGNGYGADNNGYGTDNNGYGADNNGYGADNNGYAADTPAPCKPPLKGVCMEQSSR